MIFVLKMKSALKIDRDILPNFFIRALSIVIQKCQVINRKTSCSVNKLFAKIDGDLFSKIKIEDFKKCDDEFEFKELLIKKEISFEESSFDDLLHDGESNDLYLSIDKFLPRKINNFNPCFVLTLIGKSN
jgi:hypothetical protein